jgi:hypothetical protein
MRKLMLFLMMLIAATLALAQISQSFNESPKSGKSSPSFSFSNNGNACPTDQQTASTGNDANE